MAFDLRVVTMATVEALCKSHHGYGGAGRVAAYAFAVYEGPRVVAAYAWQPPPPQAAIVVAPEAPQGVLNLSRMVAVNKPDRALKHVSKPLRVQMKRLIDRTRWPVLITYSDEGEGHNGYTYQCSGFTPTATNEAAVFVDASGRRCSSYSNGATHTREFVPAGTTTVQRWEHWICPRGDAGAWMASHGWRRVPTGKTWRSGNPAYAWIRDVDGRDQLEMFS